MNLFLTGRTIAVLCSGLSMFSMTAANAGITGYVDAVYRSGSSYSLGGWACETGSQNPVTVQLYSGGPIGQGISWGTVTANLSSEPAVAQACGSTGTNYRFNFPITPSMLEKFPGAFYVYGTSQSATGLISNSNDFGIPLTGIGSQVVNLGSVGPGWASDNTNYYSTWNCSSPNGSNITQIRRLNILPQGKLGKSQMKDSLVAGAIAPNSNGNPILYFSFADYGRKELSNGEIFYTKTNYWMLKAKYDPSSGAWQTTQYLAHDDSVSSHDGTETDYVYNKYYTPGWGPFAVTGGKIPGRDATNQLTSDNGPLGLVTIRNAPQNYFKNGDINSTTCSQMNPSMFDYDANGIPRSFIATVWTKEYFPADGVCTATNNGYCDRSVACKLSQPINDSYLLKPGPYIYRYIDSVKGWQLDASIGMVEEQNGKDYAMNADPLVNGQFIRADWDGKLKQVQASKSPTGAVTKSSKDVLSCFGPGGDEKNQMVNFSEASRGPNGAYYFLADEQVKGSGFVPTHDIYVAF